jgi:hypothetical protein
MTARSHRLWWALYPPLAVARELGIPLKHARRLANVVQRRRLLFFVVAVASAFVFGSAGWLIVLSLVTTIYDETTTFGPDGSIASTVTTGPFGITSHPLVAAVAIGPGIALLLGSLMTLVVQDLIVGDECRRCARTPACFTCGYDLSAVVGETCPECGSPRVGRPPARTVAT